MDLTGFDATQRKEWRGDTGLLPAGEYVAVLDSSEEKENSKKNGTNLELRFQIIEGQFTGSTVRAWLAIKNPSEAAVEGAWNQFGAICMAVGIPQPQSPQQLHDRPLVIKVKQEAWEGKPDTMTNKITGYAAYSRNGGSQPAASGPAAPWEKKTPF